MCNNAHKGISHLREIAYLDLYQLNQAAKVTRSKVNLDEISDVFLFSAVDGTLLKLIAAAASKYRLARGDVLFKFGDEVTHFYYVQRGRVQLSRSSSSGIAGSVLALLHGAGEANASLSNCEKSSPPNGNFKPWVS
jgi:CRP-like cAMP-binding protein